MQIYSANLATQSFNAPVTMDFANSVAIVDNNFGRQRHRGRGGRRGIPVAQIPPRTSVRRYLGPNGTSRVIVRFSNASTTPRQIGPPTLAAIMTSASMSSLTRTTPTRLRGPARRARAASTPHG
jgi:hypothetical protein